MFQAAVRRIGDDLLNRSPDFQAQSDFDDLRFAQSIPRYAEFWQRFGGCPDIRGKRVIDFGSGRGGMIQGLMEAGAASAFGIELDRHYVDYANRKVASEWDGRVQFVCGDIREIDIEPADIVVSSDVMEHVSDLEPTLRSVVHACKPGGELYIGFGPLWHSPFGHHRLIKSRIPWAHLPRGNRAFLDQFLDREGNGPQTIRELGFNGATPADFRGALDDLPVTVISARRNVATNPLKSLAMKAMLVPTIVPQLEKFFTVGIYWHLRRNNTQHFGRK